MSEPVPSTDERGVDVGTTGRTIAEAFDDDVEREVRLSVVLYGGVSLAVYMNGVCQELLNLVRATSGVAYRKGVHAHSALHEQYRLAASISAAELDERDGVDWAEVAESIDRRRIRRRVVIDVLSGSSAGGLNALFVARALLTDGDLRPFADLFVKRADFVRLLNDDETRNALPGRVGEGMKALEPGRQPTSLLDGDLFYQLLLGALDDQRSKGPPLVGALDCFITMTDLRGIPTEDVTLAEGQLVRDLQHRTVAHLRYGDRETYGANRNDFIGSFERESQVEPFLGFVGRSTAAHPAAFAPAQLHALSNLLDRRQFDPEDPRWSTLVTPSYAPAQLAKRWFSDGGALDNKPFTHAIDPVDDRRGTIPVDRRIIYVEPDPSPPSDAWSGADLPDLTAYTVGAFTLPRREGIVDDLARIERRNQRARSLKTALGDAMRPAGTESLPSSMERRLYEIDRARGLIDDLVAWIEALLRTKRSGAARDPRPDATQSLRRLVIELEDAADAQLTDDQHRRALLSAFDVAYEQRRLNFIDRVLDEHQTHLLEGPASDDDSVPRSDPDFGAARTLRSKLNEVYLRLLALERRLHLADQYDGDSLADEVRITDDDGRIVAPAWVKATLRRSVSEYDERKAVESPENRLVVEGLLEIRRSIIGQVLVRSSERARSLLVGWRVNRAASRPDLARLYKRFDAIDVHLLPRFIATKGETDPIEVSRFSPLDVEVMADRRSSDVRLGGAAVGHFGAFFDERWRRNDILWGRLDAAEQIITMLLPKRNGEPDELGRLRQTFIERAQTAIIDSDRPAIAAIAELTGRADVRADMDPGSLHKRLSKQHHLDLSLASDPKRRQTKLELLERAPAIVGRMLSDAKGEQAAPVSGDDGSRRNGPGPTPDAARSVPAGNVEGGGRAVNALVQLAAPRSLTPVLVRLLVLPALAVGAVASLVAAVPGDVQDEAWFVAGGLAVLAACAFLGSLAGRRGTPLRRLLAGVLRTIGGLAAIAGFLPALVQTDLSEAARAWCYAVLGAALAGVFAMLVFGRLIRRSGVVRASAVWLSGTAALATIIGSLVADWRTAMLVLASLVLGVVAAGSYVALTRVQKSIDGLAEPRSTKKEASSR